MKFAKKKSEDLNKISKNEGSFFGQHPLVENSPTATDKYLYYKFFISKKYPCFHILRFPLSIKKPFLRNVSVCIFVNHLGQYLNFFQFFGNFIRL